MSKLRALVVCLIFVLLFLVCSILGVVFLPVSCVLGCPQSWYLAKVDLEFVIQFTLSPRGEITEVFHHAFNILLWIYIISIIFLRKTFIRYFDVFSLKSDF